MDGSALSAGTYRGSGRARVTAILALVSLLTLVAAVTGSPSAYGAAPDTVGLGTAGSYSVLAGSTVTNTGPTVVDGDLGLSPGTAVTGFPPGEVRGSVHAADAPAEQAKADLVTAYDDAAGRDFDTTLPAELGGSEQGPGVYRFSSSAQLTGTLTLDGHDDPNSVFIFQIGSTLTTASSSSVSLVNGAQSCNVFFQVGSSATLGTGTDFVGTIMALTSITVTTGVTIEGRTLARNGAVTLDDNLFTPSACDVATVLQLTTSDSATTFGTPVTLTAPAGPGSPTGTVTFSNVSSSGADSGSAVTLGTAPLSAGTASLSVAMPAFGLNTVIASYGGDANHTAATSSPVTIEVSAYAGELIVTELRSSGPAGSGDSYAELLNGGPPIPLAGFTIASSSGSTVTLPSTAGALGTGRSYLVTGSDFSLGAVAQADAVGPLGSGGLQVLAPDTARTATDAVGPSSGAHLGVGLPATVGAPTAQHAWVRAVVSGQPKDTRDNAADFLLVSTTDGPVGGVQSMLGSPSPTGRADPYQHNADLASALIDTTVSGASVPNRVYVAGAPGNLVIRRTLTNTSAATITAAMVRVTALSEANGAPRPGGLQPARRANLRVTNPTVASQIVILPGGGIKMVHNLSVDAPSGAVGGGMNSTLSVPLSGGLAPGESVSVAFTFDVDTRDTFWFGYNVDALSAAPAANRINRLGTSKKTLRQNRERISSTINNPADSGRLR